MPTLNVKKDLLMEKLGTTYTDAQFDELCFRFGIELDEITSEKKIAMKERNATGQESDDVIYKIDIPANRYDLISLEGLVLALRIFLGETDGLPIFKPSWKKLTMHVDKLAEAVRPVIMAAVVRKVNFNKDLYDSFIDLQDKIHHNIGRKRAMVSIGTHDLDTIVPPFYYTAMKPDELKFTPLNQDKQYTASEMMTLYEQSYLKPYLPLIKDEPRYPVIHDSEGTVLSMPPIINGNVSKITMDTKNVLIEVTATDKAKATIALDTIVTMLSSASCSSNICDTIFEVEVVRIKHDSGKDFVTPDLSGRHEIISVDYINQGLGLNLSMMEICKLLNKMGLHACNGPERGLIRLGIPPTRHDIIHKCDVMEDVGIAYGYDNIAKTLPKNATIASQEPLNKLSDQLRNEVARCGYTEALNFALCSEEELSTMLNRPSDESLVRIQNPKTVEFQVARTCLLSGLLKTINSNRKMPLPMRLFEVGDVVLADVNKDVGARNERRLAAIYYGKQTSGFEIIHGLLDRVMQVLACPYIGDQPNRAECKRGYYIEKEQKDGAFLPGRGAAVVYNGSRIGSIGILHPDVVKNYDLSHPASALEINIENFDLCA